MPQHAEHAEYCRVMHGGPSVFAPRLRATGSNGMRSKFETRVGVSVSPPFELRVLVIPVFLRLVHIDIGVHSGLAHYALVGSPGGLVEAQCHRYQRTSGSSTP
jgi:hypothetical protein